MGTFKRFIKSKRGKKGQVALMMAILIMTFLFFFRVVVNTALLVNAKINLQNAADLAAYAGAAAQARLLNEVSFLNYEMRRQYKKFLFRYYVLGNLAQKGFPNTDDGNGNYVFAPSPGDDSYDVPAVCIIFQKDDNYCQLKTNPAITQVNANPLDPISISLNNALKALEQIRLKQCAGISGMNKLLLGLWVYNTDPELDQLRDFLGSQPGSNITSDTIKSLEAIRGLAQGLGLFPKNALLFQRIRGLEYYLNAPPRELTPGMVSGMESSEDPKRWERSILAFKSAYKTLGEYMFDPTTIQLTELLPGSADKANLAKFESVETDFTGYFVEMLPTKSGANGFDCVSNPFPINFPTIPVAVEKDPKIMTYYAVRLEADVKLLFSPIGAEPLRLKAYAAAQPFGSRIGPPLTQFPPGGWVANKTSHQVTGAASFGVPNLPVQAEQDDFEKGWYQTKVLQHYYKSLDIPQSADNSTLTPENYEKAYDTVMAPTPVELGQYNIISDIGESQEDPYHEAAGDPFVNYFNGQLFHRIWAPLNPGNQGASVTDTIIQTIQESGEIPGALLGYLANQISNYVTSLALGGGENGEQFNTYPLANPFRYRVYKTPDQNNLITDLLVERTPAQIKTSWSQIQDAGLANRARVGYSVKIVPLRYLLNPGENPGATTNKVVQWNNIPDLDGISKQEIGEGGELIAH